MSHVTDRISKLWRQDGVDLNFDGPLAHLEFDGRSLTRAWEEISDARAVDRNSGSFARRLFVSERIAPVAARAIREAGGWYLDTAGNAYVRAPGLLVDVHGRTTGKRRSATGDSAPETNLMSAKRAQVIFSLLTWPELTEMPRRALADAAGVSVGLAQSTISALTQERYLLPRSTRLYRQDELLDRWAAAFPLGLGRSLELGRFTGDPDLESLAALNFDVHVSGELASEGIRGDDLTLYLPTFMPELAARMRWRRAETRDAANIILRRTFWTSPPRTWGKAVPGRPALSRAPELLVLADLIASHDPRQLEIAGALRRSFLERSR